MDRRQFIGGTSCFAITLGMGRFPRMKTHVVTLSFDDGLKKSVYKTAAIYEEFGLHGCFNVIAIGHEPAFHPTVNGVDDGGIVPFERGNFDDWNRIKRRGHEVMAHTYNHVNLTTIPFEQG